MNLLIITQKVDANDPILGFFHTWVKKMSQKIERVYIISQYAGVYNFKSNVVVYSLGKEKNCPKMYRFLKLQYAFFKFLFFHNAKIVFCHMCPEYALAAFPLAKIKRARLFLWYTHGSANNILKLAHRFSDKIITASSPKHFNKMHKIVAIGHGIDCDKFNIVETQKISPDKKIIISIGRISPVKKYEILIKAMASLINGKKIGNLKLNIVGGVPIKSHQIYAHRLKRLVAELNLNNFIEFIGPVSYQNIHKYYNDCDIFISASQTNSLDKAVLEAMACGVPVITSNAAFREVLEGFGDKFLFERGNPQDLADKIEGILDITQNEILSLGKKLREIVKKHHEVNNLAEKLAEIFNNV